MTNSHLLSEPDGRYTAAIGSVKNGLVKLEYVVIPSSFGDKVRSRLTQTTRALLFAVFVLTVNGPFVLASQEAYRRYHETPVRVGELLDGSDAMVTSLLNVPPNSEYAHYYDGSKGNYNANK